MTDVPEVHYARNGDIAIAYQVFGVGPVDLVYIPGFLTHLEGAWEIPALGRFLERLGSFARVVAMDRRGAGLSDRLSADDLPALETQMDDLRVVMEAAGMEHAALAGFEDGGRLCALVAASYPELVSSLILYSMQPAGSRSGLPFAWTLDQWDEYMEQVRTAWGTEGFARFDLAQTEPDERFNLEEVRAWARYLRMAASPGSALAFMRLFIETDVTSVLPSVKVPTLVLHRTDDASHSVEMSRYVADAIPTARLVELPGSLQSWWMGDSDAILSEIEEFLTGTRRAPEIDRVLATVMFTDIVGSTEKASELGDARWRTLIADHHSRVRRELDRFRGREIDTAGDGFFATFDGPARAVRCAQAVADAVNDLGLQIRAGVHTGEVERMGDDVGGIAVHIGARVSALAGPGEVLVSSTVKDLVAGSGLAFEDRGEHELKGVPDRWRLYRVVDG